MKIKKILLLLPCCILITANHIYAYSENEITKIYCAAIGGEDQSTYHYELGWVRVDCETESEVIEAGLDKRSSLDSLQQAIFFGILSNKKPVVVIYDTDGVEGRYEYRIRKACEFAKIEYRSIKADQLETL